jgi:hypothetical protein
MDNTDFLNQYSWVLKVLDSCENEAQVETTMKLFDLYIKKYDKKFSEKQMNTLVSNFEKEKKGKLFKTRKKTSNFLSKVSQFFLF